MAEIVNGCSGGADKSWIMSTANVNSVAATEFLNKLTPSGILTASKEDDNSVVYYSTLQGRSSFVGARTWHWCRVPDWSPRER